MIKRTLGFFYTTVFLTSLSTSFVFVTYVLYLAERGMNEFQINSINSFFMLGIFLLEIPTGTFADTWGRKKCFQASLFFAVLGFGLYFFSSNYVLFVLSELLAAVAWAFGSGATEAWLVDSLKYHGFNGSLEDVFSKEAVYKQLGCVIGGLVGAYVGNFDLSWPWLMAAVGNFLVLLFVSAVMDESYFVVKKVKGWREKRDQFVSMVTDSIKFGVKVKTVFYLICLQSGLAIGFQAFNMYWTLRFKQDLASNLIGWIWVLISIFLIIGSVSVRPLVKIIKFRKYVLFFYAFITACSMLACWYFFSSFGWLLAFFLLHEFGRAGFGPIKKSYINSQIPSEKRATILSFDSMVQKIGAVLGLVVSGLIAHNYSIRTAWLFSALIVMISGFLCFKLNGREIKNKE